MANPQPNIYAKYSKELLKAKMKTRIGGVQNQVFECIMYMTYGQLPPQKTTLYDPAQISELTGLSLVAISKAKTSLSKMNMIISITKKGNEAITKNGNTVAEFIGIQKDYEKWTPLPKKVMKKQLPKMVTDVTKNGNEKPVTPIKELEEKDIAKKTTFSRWKYSKKSPLPKDFELTQDMIDYATSKNYGGDLDKFTERFVLGCTSKGYKYMNWYSAWQNWLLNDIKWNPPETNSTQAGGSYKKL